VVGVRPLGTPQRSLVLYNAVLAWAPARLARPLSWALRVAPGSVLSIWTRSTNSPFVIQSTPSLPAISLSGRMSWMAPGQSSPTAASSGYGLLAETLYSFAQRSSAARLSGKRFHMKFVVVAVSCFSLVVGIEYEMGIAFGLECHSEL